MKKEESSLKVYLAALAYSIIAGLSFVFTKIALEYNNPINILGHRFIFALMGLIIVLLNRAKLSYFNSRAFKRILPLGLVYPLLFFGFQTFGLRHVDSSIGGILLATAPIFTLILSRIFLREKPSRSQVLFVFLAVSGVIFIFYNTLGPNNLVETNILGVVLLVITSICFSIYSILAREYTKEYENLQLLTVMITIGAIGFNLLAFIWNMKEPGGENYLLLREPRYLIAIIYLGVLSTLGTSLLTNYVLKSLEPAKMSVFANLSTLISIVAGAVVLNEEIYSYHIVGAFLIIIGVLGTNFTRRK